MTLEPIRSVDEPSERILTVSEFSAFLKKNLEGLFGHIVLTGELSGLFKAQSGHIYCQIKDNSAQIKLVIFKGVASKLLFDIQEGMQVILTAQISMYQPRGELQLIAKKIEPEGIGALKLAYDQLKLKLHQEGLFDESRKQNIPDFASHIGLITSKDGAVLHDMINVIRRRNPLANIVHYVTPVQGKEATPSIIKALRFAQSENICQVYILARGGGSLEDLWNFNEEAVVREVSSFPYPIISAIGHETDVSLCDFVADKRAPTPSIAAELATPDLSDLDHHFLRTHHLLKKASLSKIQSCEQTLDYQSQRLKKIFTFFVLQIQQVFKDFYKQGGFLRRRIGEMEDRLVWVTQTISLKNLRKQQLDCQKILDLWPYQARRALKQSLERRDYVLLQLSYKLKYSARDKNDIELWQDKLHHFLTKLKIFTESHLKRYHQRLYLLSDRLESRSYQKILQRGFSLVSDRDDNVVKSIHDLTKTSEYKITFHDGHTYVKLAE